MPTNTPLRVTIRGMICQMCSKSLTGKQTKFCSKRCGKNDWKVRNREKHQLYTKRARQNYRREWSDYLQKLKDVPCIDCGNKYHPYVMDFDHIRGIKIRNVSQYIYFKSFEELKAEVDKCEIVCANCHRLRTLKRKMSLINTDL